MTERDPFSKPQEAKYQPSPLGDADVVGDMGSMPDVQDNPACPDIPPITRSLAVGDFYAPAKLVGDEVTGAPVHDAGEPTQARDVIVAQLRRKTDKR
jgi:hypothetical protein